MIDRLQIQSLLNANNVPPSALDDHIRSVLLRAHYSKHDVDDALKILRENLPTKQTRTDGLHKVFRTDQTLEPEEISRLLGVNIAIKSFTSVHVEPRVNSHIHFVSVCFSSIFVALAGLVFYMYMFKIGIFHPGELLAF